jgi:stage 0 sporulation regulatory protein
MLEAIKVKREMMIECANVKGFTCEETIKYSQELDILINEYQKATKELPKSNEEVKIAFKQMIMIWPKVCV